MNPRHEARRLCAAFACTAVILIPAACSSAPNLAEGLFYLLALIGAASLAGTRRRPAPTAPLRTLAGLTTAFFATAVLALVASGSDLSGYEHLDRYAHFLAAPLVALLLQRAGVSQRTLMLAVKFGALVAGAVALIQFASGNGRPGGAINPLLFGALSLLLGFFSVVRLPQESTRQQALSLLAFCAGGAACLLSQARGVWIGAALLLPVVLYFWYRARLLSRRPLLAICAACASLLAVSCTTPLVHNRIGDSVAEYIAFRNHTEPQNSVAIRIIMSQSGVQAATLHPLFGYGMHRTQQACAAMLAEPEVQRAVLQYTHLHNEYVTTLVGRGLTGLAGLLLLLAVPVVVFVKQAQRPERLAYNGIGALLCTGYAVSGMTNLAFGHDVMNIFFLLFLSLTLPAPAVAEPTLQHRQRADARACQVRFDSRVRFSRDES